MHAFDYEVAMNRKQVLEIIKTSQGIIVGQHAGAGSFWPDGYNTYIGELNRISGKYPGLMGVDFAWGDWENALIHVALDAGSGGHERDDRAHADDDAQHRQHRAQAVRQKSRKGDAHTFKNHNFSPSIPDCGARYGIAL